MNVKELRKELKKFPKGMRVLVAVDNPWAEPEGFDIQEVYAQEWDDGEIIQNVLIAGYYDD